MLDANERVSGKNIDDRNKLIHRGPEYRMMDQKRNGDLREELRITDVNTKKTSNDQKAPRFSQQSL
jgi:hypothetical protein